tara:strand:+ start:2421 stop:2840 length:420 start_codon:yes stop_codon:yes gene_type:complete
MPITFPSPVQCFTSLTKTVEYNNHTLLAASIKPRATWTGDRYDIAYTGYVIAQCNRRGALTRWAYDLRHSERTLNTAVCSGGFYDTAPTYEGLLQLLEGNRRDGTWHLCRDHDGVWIEVNNKKTLACYLVDRMAAPIAV